MLVPGVKSWEEYQKNRKLWDPLQQKVSLDAEFYRGEKSYLFPDDKLRKSVALSLLFAQAKRRAKSMGIDAAEGGDSTVWTVVDEIGVMYQLSLKTADTSDIPGRTIALAREYRLEPEQVWFDRGGGGTQHANELRRRGYDVRTVAFGESATEDQRERNAGSVYKPIKKRVDMSESRYAYKNRRAEMYGLASQQICSERGFAIPLKYGELLRQLKVMPKLYDGEGRLYLPPKDKPSAGYTGPTIKAMIGNSPDEADSFVLAIYGMLKKVVRPVAGSIPS